MAVFTTDELDTLEGRRTVSTEELFDLHPQPQPQTTEKPENRAAKIWELGYKHNIPWNTAEELYADLQQLKIQPRTEDETPESEMSFTAGKEPGFWEKFLTAGYEGGAKPDHYWNMSAIERAAFDVFMAGQHYMTRIGAGAAATAGVVEKKDVLQLYEDELVNNPNWYTKAPEATGFAAEQAVEYLLVKGIFQVSGLGKLLNSAGKKLASKFISTELSTLGPRTVSLLSRQGLVNLGRDALTNMLRTAPNSIAFLSTWQAGKAALLGKPKEEVADEAVAGALWGLGFSVIPAIAKSGNKAFWMSETGKQVQLSVNKAYTYLWQNFPRVMNMGRKAASSELFNRAKEEYKTRFGIEPDAAAEAKLKQVTRQWANAMDKMTPRNPSTGNAWTGKKTPDVSPAGKPPVDTTALSTTGPDIPIVIKKAPRDIGPLQKWILTTTNQAYNTKNPAIIEASETMADTGIVMKNEIESAIQTDLKVYKSVPKEYQGERFFDLMDRHYSPEEIEAAADLPKEVKGALKHFKLQDEAMRQEIIQSKREMWKAAYEGNKKEDLIAKAAELGLSQEGAKAELAERIAKAVVPDDWGRQWSHIQHVFFGQYELSWTDSEGVKHFIGKAETQADAVRQLKLFREAAIQEGKAIDIMGLSATPEINLPYDMTRLPTKHFQALQASLKEAADMTTEEIRDAMRGIVGKKAFKQKWWGALLRREGKEGFSKDFEKVWKAQTNSFYRWKHLSAMNRQVQPLIEKIKPDYPGWAEHLEDTKNFMWGGSRSTLAKAIDTELMRLPIIGEHIKPYFLERMSGRIKTALYWAHLQTAKFFVLNSMQPIETLYPVVGQKSFMEGIQLYYSKEGQDLLRKFKVSGISGKIHELGMEARRFERFTPAGASEIRNQGIAFLTLYQHGLKLGMTEEQAARYGRLRGQLFTQFTQVPSDVPKAMRGPIGGLIFQYKRFPIKSIELFSRLLRERNFGGAGRFLAAKLVLGGMKVFLSPVIATIGVGYLAYKAYEKIKEEYGEEVADVIYYGLPSLAGVDMSSSFDILDVPSGRSIPEKIGNEAVGPFGQIILRTVATMTEEKTAKEMDAVDRTMKSIESTSPTAKQFIYLIRALQQDTTSYDAKERKRYELEVKDLWARTLGFTPTSESRENLAIEAMLEIKNDYDIVHDRIALKLIDMDVDGADETARRWMQSYPEFELDPKMIMMRIENRTEARELTKLQRQWKDISDNLKGAFLKDIEKTVGQGESE
ncbi:MAG: hypothetical protein M0R06_03310 [Sphaerochaeta sp.]|jgi:hypothetical protein|nr:hypothetical protein [Sphaerochaeta sp.]